MLKRFRHLHISLAAKCQILFGAAVILIIAAALYVPWKRMDGLMRDRDLQAGEVLAVQATADHLALETALAKNPEFAAQFSALLPEARDVEPSGHIPPRIMSIKDVSSPDLGRFERTAMNVFIKNKDLFHYPWSYSIKGVDRYRLAMPLYTAKSCIECHAGDVPKLVASADTGNGNQLPSTAPTAASRTSATQAATLLPDRTESPKLLGIVVVDIASSVNARETFLNRLFILLAGLLAGTVAIIVFYQITTRLILQPVSVLQETAEKVSQGDLNIRSDISTGDEFQQLSETFNTMLTNLKSSADQLRSINKGLDLKLVQLAETNVSLYESNRLKSEFLANVSHELRTPLNSILGFAQLLRDTVPGAADAKPARYLQNILSSGQNLLDLINDLLDLAKIEAGRMDVRSEPLSLGDVFEGLTNVLKPLAEAKNVSIVPEVDPGVPILHTDPAKLQQVLYNFLANAIKFSPTGGRVDLVAQNDDDEHVRIFVRDGGPGIEADKHAVIFEKFRQIDGSVTREHSGTGLGLAISKELTALLGGTIGVQSTPGQGATFWVVLPLKTQPGTRDVRAKLVLND
jgi:signal transduction histidine kinase